MALTLWTLLMPSSLLVLLVLYQLFSWNVLDALGLKL
jgi:hypothetical protein